MLLTFCVYGYRLFICTKCQINGTSQEMTGIREPSNIDRDAHDDADTKKTACHSSPKRLYFLDSVKTFLTLLVVTHHVICTFGGCGEGSPGIVGNYSNTFQMVFGLIAALNQAYFMPLFFFISAYFTPISYRKKGRNNFMYDKAKRLWIPAMLTSFIIIPITVFITIA